MEAAVIYRFRNVFLFIDYILKFLEVFKHFYSRTSPPPPTADDQTQGPVVTQQDKRSTTVLYLQPLVSQVFTI